MSGADTLDDLTGSLEGQLAVGFLAALDAWSLVTWRPLTEYQPSDVRPAYLGPTDPPNAPDERVLLTPRVAVQVPGSQFVDVPLGFLYRGPVGGSALVALDVLGAVRRRLRGLPPQTYGTVRASLPRVTGGVLPVDGNRRPLASATILFRCRPARVN